MRSLIAAISLSGLALTTGAFAQTTPQPPPAAQTTPQIPTAQSEGQIGQVAQEHLGIAVKCHKCGQAFSVQPTVLTAKSPTTEPIPQTAGVLRLDIAGVTSVGRERSRNEDSFLVQHLTWSDLNQNHQPEKQRCRKRS